MVIRKRIRNREEGNSPEAPVTNTTSSFGAIFRYCGKVISNAGVFGLGCSTFVMNDAGSPSFLKQTVSELDDRNRSPKFCSAERRGVMGVARSSHS
jgi:hypothetical protein